MKTKTTALILSLALAGAGKAAWASEFAADPPEVVKPGDTITITVLDEATGQPQTITAVVSGTFGVGPSASTSASTSDANTFKRTTVFKQVGTPVEILSLDPAARRLTVLDEERQLKIFYVDEATTASLTALEPGQKTLLSYRFNEDGKAEALFRPARPTVNSGATVSVLATDPGGKTLTVRDARGSRRSYLVENDAAKDLSVLAQGDTVLIGLRDDKVVAITRK